MSEERYIGMRLVSNKERRQAAHHDIMGIKELKRRDAKRRWAFKRWVWDAYIKQLPTRRPLTEKSRTGKSDPTEPTSIRQVYQAHHAIALTKDGPLEAPITGCRGCLIGRDDYPPRRGSGGGQDPVTMEGCARG